MKFLTLSGAAKYWILLVTGLFTSSALMAQCINTQLGSNCTPGAFPSSGITLSASTGAVNKLYSLNTGNNHLWATYLGACYNISSCGAANDTQLGLFSPTSGMLSPFAYDDDNGPSCTGTSASANFVSNYSGDITVTFRVYNCAVTVAATNVSIRQNNNLVITSSGASMCEGSMRALTATPAAQPTTLQAHTRAVGEWLSELYAVMVDPCAEGQTTPQAMCEAIMAAALQARELAAVTPADVRMLTPREIELLREIRLHAQFGLNEGWQREARNLLLELEQYYRTIPPSGEIGGA